MVILKYVLISIYFIDMPHANVVTEVLHKMNELTLNINCVKILGISTVIVVRYTAPHSLTVLSLSGS